MDDRKQGRYGNKPFSQRNRNNYGNKPYDRQEQQLSFADSWRQTSVELAATAGIIGGAAALGMTGNFGPVINSAKKTGKQVAKRFNTYLDGVGPGVRFAKDTLIGTFRRLKGYPGASKEFDPDFLNRQMSELARNVDETKVDEIAKQRWFEANKDRAWQNGGRDLRMSDNKEFYKEQARTEEKERIMREQNQHFQSGNRRERGNRDNDTSDKSQDGNAFQKAVGAGLTGFAFGGGITAFHGIDQWARKKDKGHHQRKMRSFDAAGSFIKEDGHTKKANLYRNIHDSLSGLGERVPQAVATGLGYTGVSLGTAALLKHHPELLANSRNPIAAANQPKNENQNGPRIIIELGDEEKSHHPLSMSGYGMSPHVASEEGLGLAKLAELGVGRFVSNVFGRPSEVRHLADRLGGHTADYASEAAAHLKNMDAEGVAEQQFGHLVGPNNPQEALNHLHRAMERKLRMNDEAKLDGLRNEIAKSRVLAGAGGLGLAGIGAGISAFHHKDGEQT